MAVKRTSGTATDSGKNTRSTTGKPVNGAWRGIPFVKFVVIPVVFCIFVIGMICIIPGKLMYKNQRFALRHIEVNSPGFWNNKGEMLISRLGDNSVTSGTNIFRLDVGNIRKKLLKISNIEDAEVRIVLPDMIVFNIRERIPRAEIDGGFVVDEYGKLFKRSESSAADRTLPRLIKKNPDPKLQKEAIDLIMTATRECQNIVIESIKIDNPHYFEVRLLTMIHNNRSWKILFPIGSESYSILFNKLQSAILHTYLNRENPVGFDLRFKNYASPLYK